MVAGVDVDIAGGIATVTINRPDKANALDGPMHHTLTTVWQELESDEHVGAAVITGAGSTFCAGGDRSKWPALAEDRRYRRRRMIGGPPARPQLASLHAPVVAAVNGPAVGVGCTIVAACDIVLIQPTPTWPIHTSWLGSLRATVPPHSSRRSCRSRWPGSCC